MNISNLFLLNNSILTSYGIFEHKQIELENAKSIVNEAVQVESLIGHATSAESLSELLEIDLKPNLRNFIQSVGDVALIFKLRARPIEGKLITR